MDIKNRRGCIRISHQLLDEMDIQFRKLLFSNFYPINIETIEFGDKIFYGYSEHFKEAIEGSSIQYEATINTVKNEIKFSHI